MCLCTPSFILQSTWWSFTGKFSLEKTRQSILIWLKLIFCLCYLLKDESLDHDLELKAGYDPGVSVIKLFHITVNIVLRNEAISMDDASHVMAIGQSLEKYTLFSDVPLSIMPLLVLRSNILVGVWKKMFNTDIVLSLLPLLTPSVTHNIYLLYGKRDAIAAKIGYIDFNDTLTKFLTEQNSLFFQH